VALDDSLIAIAHLYMHALCVMTGLHAPSATLVMLRFFDLLQLRKTEE